MLCAIMVDTSGKRAVRKIASKRNDIQHNMRKTIAIGESVLDTMFRDDKPVCSFVGGRIANAAASLGMAGIPVEMVSECCNDHVGDIIVNNKKNHNVGTASVDRYTDGSSAVSMIFYSKNGDKKLINYFNYPDDHFDVVWPRIDEDDVILFGSFYSIDPDMRERFYELIKYAHERKAVLVYLLGCQHGIGCRITKVMPGILENLEMADIVIATQGDLNAIFPGETADQAFKNHIEFYCSNFLHIGEDSCITVYHRRGEKTFFDGCRGQIDKNPLGWQSGLASGIIYALFANGILHDAIDNVDAAVMDGIIKEALEFAVNASASMDVNCIDSGFALEKAEKLKHGPEENINSEP